MSFASSLRYIPASIAQDITIGNGGSIKVYNIVVSSAFFLPTNITLKEFIGGATIATFNLLGLTTFIFNGNGFLCPKGLTISLNVEAQCTITYSNVGA